MKGYGMIGVDNPGWLEKVKPVTGPLDAIIRPTMLAPCTSDTHMMHGGNGEHENIILGHEVVGEVVEVGELVHDFKAGDIVVVATTTPDQLAESVQGKYHQHDHGLIQSFKFLGSKDGVMAEYFHVNQADANMVLLPEGVKAEQAVMVVDMMSTGFHGVELAEIEFGDTVAVIGIGPVGLMAVAGCQLRGAGRIFAVGTRPNCVKIAKEYGATDIINYKEGDIVEQIITANGGQVDKVIIAGGTQDSFPQAVSLTKPGGIVSNLNFFDITETLTMPSYLWGLGMSHIDIRGGFCPGGKLRIKKLLELVKYSRIDPSKIISHRYEGFEKIEEAFLLMDSKEPELIKPIVSIKWQF